MTKTVKCVQIRKRKSPSCLYFNDKFIDFEKRSLLAKQEKPSHHISKVLCHTAFDGTLDLSFKNVDNIV